MGTDCGAYSAVMALVVMKIMFLLPFIAGVDIQKFFAGYSRIPYIAFQCRCRTGLNTGDAVAAEVSLCRRGTGEFHPGENCPNANPWSKLACDKLAMTADPARPGWLRSFEENHL